MASGGEGQSGSKALDLMIEKDMPIGESYARSESFEILPFGPPCANWARWAKISPLSRGMWISLEQQALSFP